VSSVININSCYVISQKEPVIVGIIKVKTANGEANGKLKSFE
jgi:hypothetical protein